MLWFLRHAEAAEGSPDAARPLTQRGIRQAQIAGLALSRLGINLDICLSSPKRRAMETAQLACAPIGVDVITEPALADSGYDAERLAAGHGDVMLVGHNPSLSIALHDLSGARVDLRKAGIAGVERRELVVLMTPAELEAVANMTEAAA